MGRKFEYGGVSSYRLVSYLYAKPLYAALLYNQWRES